MTKLCYQYWGSGIALGIAGTKEEVSRMANRLYNHKVTDGEIIWMNERPETAFGYIITTKEKLKAGYESIYLTGERVKRLASKTLSTVPMRQRMKTVARLKSEYLFPNTDSEESTGIEALNRKLTDSLPKIPLVNFLGMSNKEDTIFTLTNDSDSEHEE